MTSPQNFECLNAFKIDQWCNGSTKVSGTFCWGSSPYWSTFDEYVSAGLGRPQNGGIGKVFTPSVPPFFASGFCRAIRRERRACKFACLPLILGEPQKPATARISRNSRADIPEHCAVRQEGNRKQGAICRARKREMNFPTRKSANIRKDITPTGGPPSPC